MEKRLLYLLASLSIILPTTAPVFVRAEDTPDDSAQTANEDEVMTTTTSTETEDETEGETKTAKERRAARIEAYKKKSGERLTFAIKMRLKDRCQKAQGIISSYAKRNNSAASNRINSYEAIAERLDKAAKRLTEAGIDAEELQTAAAELADKIIGLNALVDTYKQSLEDLALLDCKADPEGFKAALLVVRSNQGAVRKMAEEIHNFLKDTVKPILKSLKEQARSKEV